MRRTAAAGSDRARIDSAAGDLRTEVTGRQTLADLVIDETEPRIVKTPLTRCPGTSTTRDAPPTRTPDSDSGAM